MGLPQTNSKNPIRDLCQTPDYALDPLIPYLRRFSQVWEPARGEGFLVKALRTALPESEIMESDILLGLDYFTYQPPQWEVQVTNVPFSKKYKWLARAYDLNKPFALLMPVSTGGAASAHRLFEKYGVQFMFMSPRINYKMPNRSWDGKGAQFASYWVTWGLNLPHENNYAIIHRRKQPETAEQAAPPKSAQMTLWEAAYA